MYAQVEVVWATKIKREWVLNHVKLTQYLGAKELWPKLQRNLYHYSYVLSEKVDILFFYKKKHNPSHAPIHTTTLNMA